MNIIKTEIPDVVIIEPTIFGDERGWFYESYNREAFEKAGIKNVFLQDNQSFSTKGVLRGLHYQLAPYSQAKLVRVLSGKILDVVVDIRKGSPYYGKWVSVILSAENKNQLFIPRGFAHGFVILSDTADFFYKCDNFYNPAADRGIKFDDKELAIDWQVDLNDLVLSEKDKNHPSFCSAENNFVYGEI